MRSRWGIWSREVTLFDLHFHRLPLAAGYSIMGVRTEAEGPFGGYCYFRQDKFKVVFGIERVNSTSKGATKAVLVGKWGEGEDRIERNWESPHPCFPDEKKPEEEDRYRGIHALRGGQCSILPSKTYVF